MHDVRLLLVPGSLRTGSTNVAVLRTARVLLPDGVTAELYEGLATLPHFNPDEDPDGGPVAEPVAVLRSAIAASDALLFCTPEYAGALPGSFKNALEWTVGDASTYRKPVAWINASSAAAPSGGQDAHDSLRKVLGYVGAEVVEAACTRVVVARAAITDGVVTDDQRRGEIARAVRALVDAVRARARGRLETRIQAGRGADLPAYVGDPRRNRVLLPRATPTRRGDARVD